MRIWPVAARYPWFGAVADNVARRRASREETPLRTIFNSRTGQFEQMRLTEFQQLLCRGEVQETIAWQPDRSPRYVYRLV